MIDSISGLVDTAVNNITSKVDGVREWSNRDPCARQAFLYEEANNVRPKLTEWKAQLAFLETAGPAAVAANIANKGRASASIPIQYAGGKRWAAWLADNVIPEPPAAILHAILGGPIGAGAAREAWLDWIDQVTPSGQPSASTQGTKLFPWRSGIRMRGGQLGGPDVAEAYPQWVAYQLATVQPFGRANWSAKVAAIGARVDVLDYKMLQIDTDAARYADDCDFLRGWMMAGDDRDAEAGIDAARGRALTERLKALAPWAVGLALVALWKK